LPEQSISEEPVRVGVLRIPERLETLEGRLNGRRVVSAVKRGPELKGQHGLPLMPWEVTVSGVIGQEFSFALVDAGVEPVEETVRELTELVASAILRPYPLETTPEEQ